MRSCATCERCRTSASIRTSAELARLQAAVTEGLKRFEFDLRRQIAADGAAVALSGSDEVPEAYRKLVEEYTRSLAKSPR